MRRYIEVQGDLIMLAQRGVFDVIAHGCNCFCRQKSGLAPQMVAAFGTDKFRGESLGQYGDINKLGTIDSQYKFLKEGENDKTLKGVGVYVVNCYTQYKIKQFSEIEYEYTTKDPPFDYEAFTLCMRKINDKFSGLHLGLPQIGSKLAGGDWNRIRAIIQKETTACDVTVVVYNK